LLIANLSILPILVHGVPRVLRAAQMRPQVD
jgi:hypothetical protein